MDRLWQASWVPIAGDAVNEGHRQETDIGVVVIGRNEGERLRRCLVSVTAFITRVVYVDSGSTDDSVEMARAMGVTVVELNTAIPFTAARARNEGFRRLQAMASDLSYVQFVDGDCEVVAGWLERAVEFLDQYQDVAAVCGRRRERHPDRSIFNMLCDMEWATPVGEARACGGDGMIRIDAFKNSGGYRDDLIAGEEPELCVRLRSNGWRIWRLDAEMTLHDAAMTHFRQWWKRAVRGGYAYAQGAHIHGAPPERHCVRESRRAWAWGVMLPLLVLVMTFVSPMTGGVLFFAYPLQVVRIALRADLTSKANWLRSFFLVLARFPEAQGQLRFLATRLRGKRGVLIEYK